MKTIRSIVVAFILALLLIATLAVAPIAGLSASTGGSVALASGIAIGHDNTTAPHTWTHADPNTLDPPGFNRLGSNYYYLKIKAIGAGVVCTVFSGGNWEIALEDANKHVLAHSWPLVSGGQVAISNAKVGAEYMCRISDLGVIPARDYAQLDSGPVGAVSGCGAPGPVIDPNWDAAPMQPLAATLAPCIATLAPYTPGDRRLAPPPAQTFDLGTNKGAPTYTLTVSGGAPCDLTAGTFFGSQGHLGTLTITDASGHVVNGVKWGMATPNPGAGTQEFVGADAGVVALGVYHVHFQGPGNGHEVYAVCQ